MPVSRERVICSYRMRGVCLPWFTDFGWSFEAVAIYLLYLLSLWLVVFALSIIYVEKIRPQRGSKATWEQKLADTYISHYYSYTQVGSSTCSLMLEVSRDAAVFFLKVSFMASWYVTMQVLYKDLSIKGIFMASWYAPTQVVRKDILQ